MPRRLCGKRARGTRPSIDCAVRWKGSLFWRERSDDCFKARVAPQRVPKLTETQMTVGHMASRHLCRIGQVESLFDCAILVAGPCINDGKILGQHRAIERVFADRQQLNCALALADCLVFISQRGVHHTERAESRCIVRLIAHYLLEFFSRASEGGTSCRLIAAEPGDKTLTPTVRKRDVFVVAPICGHTCQRALGGSWIPLAQGEVEPLVNENRRCVWILGQDRLNCRV